MVLGYKEGGATLGQGISCVSRSSSGSDTTTTSINDSQTIPPSHSLNVASNSFPTSDAGRSSSVPVSMTDSNVALAAGRGGNVPKPHFQQATFFRLCIDLIQNNIGLFFCTDLAPDSHKLLFRCSIAETSVKPNVFYEVVAEVHGGTVTISIDGAQVMNYAHTTPTVVSDTSSCSTRLMERHAKVELDCLTDQANRPLSPSSSSSSLSLLPASPQKQNQRQQCKNIGVGAWSRNFDGLAGLMALHQGSRHFTVKDWNVSSIADCEPLSAHCVHPDADARQWVVNASEVINGGYCDSYSTSGGAAAAGSAGGSGAGGAAVAAGGGDSSKCRPTTGMSGSSRSRRRVCGRTRTSSLEHRPSTSLSGSSRNHYKNKSSSAVVRGGGGGGGGEREGSSHRRNSFSDATPPVRMAFKPQEPSRC